MEILTSSTDILVFFTKSLSKISNFLKISACSYFIFYLVSFEILSLFYIFLNINTIPFLTKQIYYKLLNITFMEEDMCSWIQIIFNLNDDPCYLTPEAKEIPELI
jgi:hypothetical protein